MKESLNNNMAYSLILMDFSMPVVDGITATHNIRKYLNENVKIDSDQQPKIIGVTGHAL